MPVFQIEGISQEQSGIEDLGQVFVTEETELFVVDRCDMIRNQGFRVVVSFDSLHNIFSNEVRLPRVKAL